MVKIRVQANTIYATILLEKAKEFFQDVTLPELCAEVFTRPTEVEEPTTKQSARSITVL